MFLTYVLWLRQYPSLQFMAFLSGYSVSHIQRMLWDVAFALKQHAIQSVRWPSYEERLLTSVIYHGMRIVIIFDGYEQEVIAFTDRILRRAVFSGKYNRVTVCRMVGVDPKTGRLIFYSCCNQGNRNNNFADPHYELPLEDDEAVCIDKGIKSAEDVYNFVVVPQFKHSRRTTPDWQRQRNYDVSHFRILVENTIAFLKDFNIIGHKFRANGTFEEILGKNDVVFHSVAWLHACFLHPEGIRKTPVKRYSIK